MLTTTTTTNTLADALQTWISTAPTHLTDLVAPHTRPGDTPAQHAATHASALANDGRVFRLLGVTMTHDEVLDFTTRINETENGRGDGDRAPFYPLATYYPPVGGIFAAETPIPGNGTLPTLTPDTQGLYRLDVLGTVLAPALSPEVRRFAHERLDVIEYYGVFHVMEIVGRHVSTWGSWADASDAVQAEITEATRAASDDHSAPSTTATTATDVAHAIECVGPIGEWVCDAENFWGVIPGEDGAPYDAYYGEPVPTDWPDLTDDQRTGALFYLATTHDHILTGA